MGSGIPYEMKGMLRLCLQQKPIEIIGKDKYMHTNLQR